MDTTLAVSERGADDLARELLGRPAGDQPWMKAASRFRGGAQDWQWAPEHMREVQSWEVDVDDHVYVTVGYGDGGRPGDPPVFTVFTVGQDEIGEPEVFMAGDAPTLDGAADLCTEVLDGYGWEGVNARELREALEQRVGATD